MSDIGPRRPPSKRTGGPRSVEGKSAVSKNAGSHGVNAALVVIHGADAAEFEQLFHNLIGDFSPLGTAETLLVHRIAHVIRNQRRLEKFEHDQVTYAAMGMIAPKDILIKMQVAAESTQYLVKLERMDELVGADLKTAQALNAECERYDLDGDDFFSPFQAKNTFKLLFRELQERLPEPNLNVSDYFGFANPNPTDSMIHRAQGVICFLIERSNAIIFVQSNGDEIRAAKSAIRAQRLTNARNLGRSHRYHTLLENQMFHALKELRAMQFWRVCRQLSAAVDNPKAASQ